MAEEKDKDPAESADQEAAAVATEEGADAAEAEAEEKKVPYEIVEQNPLEGSVLQFKVSIPRENHETRVEEMFKDLGHSVTIEGFRRGKAPRKLLQIRYGKEVGEDAVNALAGNVVQQIVESQKLEPVAEAEVKSSILGEGSNPLEIVFEMEVRPKLTISGYDKLEVEVTERSVTDEMVDRHLDQIRQASAQFKTAPEGAKYNPGDGAVIDYEVLDSKGQALSHLCRTDCFEQDLAARTPPALAEKLPGLATGVTISAEVASTHRTRRGEERTSVDTHRLTLKEIKIRELPELDDEFAKDLGEFDSLADLKERIRKDLQTQIDSGQREESLAKVYDKLLEANPFDPPKTLVASTAVQMMGGAAQRLATYGMRFSDISEDSQRNYIVAAQRDAQRGVKINLLIDAIARQENVEVADEDVEKAIERMAEREGRRALAIRARLERERRLDPMKSDLLVDKVNDLLLSRTEVKKVAAPAEPEPAAQPEKA